MLGGIIGKVIYAYLVTTIAVSIANGKSPLENFKAGLKQSFAQYNKGASNLPMLLAGAGAAFIAFNFMAGYSSAWKSMASVAALLLTVRSMGSAGGFFVRFLSSVFSKAKEEGIKKLKIQAFTAGMAAGFALTIPVSFIRGNFLCYMVGIVLLIAALITYFVYKPNKEAKAV
jgi:hypothetical protein